VAVVCGAAVAALVIGLSGSSHPSAQPQHGPSPRPGQGWPTASPIPTAGNLQLAQLRAGDCLTGANMKLNTSNPWPKLTSAVPCNQPHTAEVFFADNRFWPANGSFPGSGAIAKDGAAACNSAFRSYVGIEFSKSIYTWTNIIPDASTWPSGDRGLHCIAYYSPPGHPSGATITGSIKGSRKLFIAARYARYGPAFPGSDHRARGHRVNAAHSRCPDAHPEPLHLAYPAIPAAAFSQPGRPASHSRAAADRALTPILIVGSSTGRTAGSG
jgi:hypothetical protein